MESIAIAILAWAIVGNRPRKNCNITRCKSYAPRPVVTGLRCSGFASLLAPLNHILPARKTSAALRLCSNGRAKRHLQPPLDAMLFRAFLGWCFRAILGAESWAPGEEASF